MKIYIAHSREFDFQNELYKPLQQSAIAKKHEIIFPHEKNNASSNTRDFYKEIDLVIAECSYPSTGLGIELGWAYDDDKPIYCIYKKENIISGSIKQITNNIIEYTNTEDMIKNINRIIQLEEK